MKMKTLVKSALLFFAAILLAISPRAFSAENDEPPHELFSPDKRYSVKMLDTALPGVDPDDECFTLVVRAGDRVLSRLPTMGYLIDAFWSPDGKYVAVNNRRANSGDYLWVFSLPDGRAIKTPVDVTLPADKGTNHPAERYERTEKALVKRMTAAFPELTPKQFRKLFISAEGWTAAGELRVKTNLAFGNLPENQRAVLQDTYRIEGGKLVFAGGKAEKVARPPQKP